MMGRGYSYGYGMSNGGWLGGIFMLLFGAVVIVGIVLLVIWAVRANSGHHVAGGPPPHPSEAGHHEAIAIAKRRLASGEITKEQYDEIMRTLAG
jgi:putative membrane protein